MKTPLIIVLLTLLLLLPTAFAEDVIEFDFLITKDDTVSLYNLRVFEGKRDPLPVVSNYSLTIYDTQGYSVAEVGIPVYFVVLDPLEEVPETVATLRVPYLPSYHRLGVYHEGKIIYEHNISFLCQRDAICSPGENSISCPADCFSGGKDRLCDRVKDSICDPDCIAGDGDCDIPEQKMINRVVIGIVLLLVLFVVLEIVFLYLKRKSKYEHK